MSVLSLDGAQAELTIDLDALKANWQTLAARARPAECGAVVKADAYGIGIEEAVPALERAGCRTFFVAHLAEGVRARKALWLARGAGDDSRIFLLHGLQPGAMIHPDLLRYRLGPVLGSMPEIEAWCSAVPDLDAPYAALQFDTGMNRIGFPLSALGTLSVETIRQAGITLLMSHLVAAEECDNPMNAAQIAAFNTIRAAFPGVPASLANSSGIFLAQDAEFDLVRPGYALYGGNPCPGRPNSMQPVVRLRAAVLQTRTIEAGQTVGYNGRWVAQRPTRLATIGIGYADGLPRNADTLGSERGPCAIAGGVRCPLVGRISMDLIVVDVTDAAHDECVPGEALEMIGQEIGIDDFARSCGITGYEVLTSLGRRYHRRYLEASDDLALS